MTLRVTTIQLKGEDSISILVRGSIESSISIKMKGDEVCVIEAPANQNGRKFRLTARGLKEVLPDEELRKRIAVRLKQGASKQEVSREFEADPKIVDSVYDLVYSSPDDD